MTKFLYHRRTHGPPPASRPPPETPPASEGSPLPAQPAAAAAAALPLAVIYSSEAGETPAPSYRCLMCSKVFSKHPQLARHQRFVHRLERRHKC
ncbi:ZN574 protein, partial [Calonectris borealis]|nr:ZN574 protein [Calonectris borealis]